MSNQKQISNLSSQVETLGAINSTLQRYLEVVISKVSPDDAPELIKSEHARLTEIEKLEQLKKNDFYLNVFISDEIEIEHFKQALFEANTFVEFGNILAALTNNPAIKKQVSIYENESGPIEDLNEARVLLGKEPFPTPIDDDKLTKKFSGRKKQRR